MPTIQTLRIQCPDKSVRKHLLSVLADADLSFSYSNVASEVEIISVRALGFVTPSKLLKPILLRYRNQLKVYLDDLEVEPKEL